MKLGSPFSISISLAAVLIVTGSVLEQTADAQLQEEHFTRTFSVNSGSTLLVENFKGTIHVAGTETKQVTVNVAKVFEGSEIDRKWWMENTQVSFDHDPSRVRVAVQYPNVNCDIACGYQGRSDYTGAVELTILVPTHTNLDLAGHKPDMRISAIDGEVRIRSHKSPIDVASTIGSIDIVTYKETVSLRDVGLRGPLHLAMQKGEATVEAKRLGGEISIETEKGTVALRVPPSAGLTVDYSGGRRANFHSDLPITSEAGFGSGELRGTINGGGTHLRIRTVKGSITLQGQR